MVSEKDHYIEIKPITHFSLNIRELWQNRELIYFFVWRDLKVKYKQTIIGVLWVFIQPLTLLAVFYFALSKSIQPNLHWMNYGYFVLTGLVLWQLFSVSISQAAESMVSNANIIKKIYFPRLVIPIAAIGNALVDFTIMSVTLIIGTIIFNNYFHVFSFLYILGAIILTLLAAFGIGCLLAAMNLKFRDVRYALPFLIQLLLFSSTVLYPLDFQDASLNLLKSLHPLNGAMHLWRCAFSNEPLDIVTIFLGFVNNIILFSIGIYYFRKTEAFFADIA